MPPAAGGLSGSHTLRQSERRSLRSRRRAAGRRGAKVTRPLNGLYSCRAVCGSGRMPLLQQAVKKILRGLSVILESARNVEKLARKRGGRMVRYVLDGQE